MRRSIQCERNIFPSTMCELLKMRAEQQPCDVAYTFMLDAGGKQEVTYSDLDRSADSIACMLGELGIRDQRALLLYPPGLDSIAAFFGCLRAGVIAVPGCPPDHANPLRLARSLRRLVVIADDANPSVVLTTAAMNITIGSLCRATPGLSRLRVITTDDVPADYFEAARPAAVSAGSVALLQYIASAAGQVAISHRTLMSAAELTCRSFGHSRESRGVTWLPPHHDMGLIGGIIQPLYGGFPVTLLAPADFLSQPIRWLQEISRTRATTSGGPGFAYDLCVRKTTAEERRQLDLSSWRVAFNGSETIRQETMKNFARAFESAGFRRETFLPCSWAARPAGTDKEIARLYCWTGGSRVPLHAATDADSAADWEGWRLAERPRWAS